MREERLVPLAEVVQPRLPVDLDEAVLRDTRRCRCSRNSHARHRRGSVSRLARPNARCFPEATRFVQGCLQDVAQEVVRLDEVVAGTRSPLCSRASPRPHVGPKTQTVPA